MTSNHTDFSASVSDAVGWTKITALGSSVSARAISTICWLAMDRVPTMVRALNPTLSRDRMASVLS